MPQKVPERVPGVAVVVQVGHGGLERGLQRVALVLEEPEHDAPDDGCEPGEHGAVRLRGVASLDHQLDQCVQDAGQQVQVDLGRGCVRVETQRERETHTHVFARVHTHTHTD